MAEFPGPLPVELLPAVFKDLNRLDKPIRERALSLLRRLSSESRFLGKPLAGNLVNCREVHLAHRYRIVYTLLDDEVLVLVVAVGKRENLLVYREAAERLANLNRTAEPN